MTMTQAIEKVIATAKAEVGYLEKKSNSNLDDKTANAGSNNYTKYWRDITNWKLGNYQAQYWCAAFIFWCFVKTFGRDKAKKLLLHAPYISCATAGNLFKQAGRLYAEPKVGDVVLFMKSSGTFGHTGLVYKVANGYFYTIEGNTSSVAGVVANGGAVAYKSYSVSGAKSSGHKFARPDYSLVGTVTSSTTTKTNTTTTKKIPTLANSNLKKGSKGTQVGYLQQDLNYLNFKGKDGRKLTVDKEFGANTEYALKAFQKKYGLTVDGIYGSKSQAKMKTLLK